MMRRKRRKRRKNLKRIKMKKLKSRRILLRVKMRNRRLSYLRTRFGPKKQVCEKLLLTLPEGVRLPKVLERNLLFAKGVKSQ
jgi:hypothetical protein